MIHQNILKGMENTLSYGQSMIKCKWKSKLPTQNVNTKNYGKVKLL